MKHKVLEKNRSISINTVNNPLSSTLSEHALLYVQNLFTTPGFHTLYVKDIQTGRAIIKNQLEALAWYHLVGLITHENQSFTYAHNITHEFKNKIIDRSLLENFFLEKFYYDFLWVECTKELTAMTWINDFEEQLLLYRLDQTIPIIIVQYI